MTQVWVPCVLVSFVEAFLHTQHALYERVEVEIETEHMNFEKFVTAALVINCFWKQKVYLKGFLMDFFDELISFMNRKIGLNECHLAL